MFKRMFKKWSGADREIAELRRVVAWFGSGGTGMSSESMAIHLSRASNIAVPGRGGEGELRAVGLSTPSDSADLGRCIRFLRFMGWEHRYGEMLTASKAWARMVEYWPNIVEAYDREIKGTEPKGWCYALMKHCEAGASPATFDPKNHPYVFTYQVDMPGVYYQFRVEKGLPVYDVDYPIDARSIGTHRYRVYLSPAAMQSWVAHTEHVVADKSNPRTLRDSASKAGDALREAIARYG